MRAPAAVTFDLYSALVDSISGLEVAFAELGRRRGWRAHPGEVARDWDRTNKGFQRDVDEFVSYAVVACRALRATYERLGLVGDAEKDTDFLLSTMPQWPHYPDVPEGVAAVAERYPVALLTNADDELVARTNSGFDFPLAVTSQQARCYKPHPGLYRYAESRLGTPLLHVPASARDVRGALEAGIEVVRVLRPGHELDPQGPRPALEVEDLRDLAGLVP